MAKPRIFISSTFYDLKQIRQDLDRFVRELGYEPVRHEAGAITYGKDKRPESYAYQEIDSCDILVSIIGGRFGSQSHDSDGYSISQTELRIALEKGTPVYIFIEKSTYAEFGTYQLNKDNDEVRYQYADDKRIFQFIEEIGALPKNNPIEPFETSDDITRFLQDQWAGLFKRMLQSQTREKEIAVLDEIKNVATTLESLVEFLTADRDKSDRAVKDILFTNHPAFRRFQKVTSTTYRVFFTNRLELNKWLAAIGWKQVSKEALDRDSLYEWYSGEKYIRVTEELFNPNGTLMSISDSDWDDGWISIGDIPNLSDDGPAEDQ